MGYFNKCTRCNKEWESSHPGKFCSSNCNHLHKQAKVRESKNLNFNCHECGCPFKAQRAGVKFCSPACNNDFLYKKERSQVNLNRECPNCNVKFTAKSKKAICCSNTCTNSLCRKKWPEKHATRQAKRRALKLLASPSWLSNKDVRKIAAFYRLSKYMTIKTGIKYEVDHIVPLLGKEVRGLHVPWNLQILTAKDNACKSNKVNLCS